MVTLIIIINNLIRLILDYCQIYIVFNYDYLSLVKYIDCLSLESKSRFIFCSINLQIFKHNKYNSINTTSYCNFE